MTEWIITCNTNAYNVEGAFEKLNKIDWKQSTNVEVGDIIYIYVGAPVGKICFKCIATKVELEEREIEDTEFVIDDTDYGNYGRYMELTLQNKFNDVKLGYNQLRENGLKTVQGRILLALVNIGMSFGRLWILFPCDYERNIQITNFVMPLKNIEIKLLKIV